MQHERKTYFVFVNMLMRIFSIEFRFTEILQKTPKNKSKCFVINGFDIKKKWKKKLSLFEHSYLILIPMRSGLWEWLWNTRTSWQYVRCSYFIRFKQTKHWPIPNLPKMRSMKILHEITIEWDDTKRKHFTNLCWTFFCSLTQKCHK